MPGLSLGAAVSRGTPVNDRSCAYTYDRLNRLIDARKLAC